MRGWPLLFGPSEIALPYWVENQALGELLTTVMDNTGWGAEELSLTEKRVSQLLPFMHIVDVSDTSQLGSELILSVSGDQFTVPVIANNLALSEPVNCFAVPSKLGSKVYIVNAVLSEEYVTGTLSSSGYLYFLPEPAEGEGTFFTDGDTPFKHTFATEFVHPASGLYIRYLPKDFVALSKQISVYTDHWIKADPVIRYVNEHEDMAIYSIQTRVPLVSESELITAIELKKKGRVSVAEPEWGIASELYLGAQFSSDNVPSGILNVSYQGQLKEFAYNNASTLFWTPVYTGEYVSSVEVALPSGYTLPMVGYRGVKIRSENSPSVIPCVWGNSYYYESDMDVLT